MSSNIYNTTTAMNATKKDKKVIAKKKIVAASEHVITAAVEPVQALVSASPVSASPVSASFVSASLEPVPVVETTSVPVKTSFQEEAANTMSQLSAIQDAVKAAIASLKELEKRHKREVKDARKRRKRNNTTADNNGDDAASATGEATREIRPCVFTTPIPLDDKLAVFLNKMPGEMICPKDITHLVNVYATEHNLREKRFIKPDAAMAKVFDIPAGATTTHRDLQRKIYKIIKDKL